MDFNDNKPIYLQLADQIMDEVAANDISDSKRLLSVREYAANVGVNANTVMRTYTWLQQEEVIYNQRGIGYFYSPGARDKVREIRRRELMEKEIKVFIERLISADISPDDFKRIYDDYLRTAKAGRK